MVVGELAVAIKLSGKIAEPAKPNGQNDSTLAAVQWL